MHPKIQIMCPPQQLPRHEIWRLQYRRDRYAEHLSQPELDERIHDIVLNLLTVGTNGIGIRMSAIPAPEVSNASTAFIEKFTHMLEEMKFRHGHYPNGFSREIMTKAPLPDFASELARKAALRLQSIGAAASDLYIKFGRRQYMESLYESGSLRIQPATFFAGAIHNTAIKDDELTIGVSLATSRHDLTTLVNNPDDLPSDLPSARIDIVVRLESDHWLYCVSSSLEPRLFLDYDADACVIIRDRSRFTRMLQTASLQELSGTRFCDGGIQYVDPLLPKSLPTSVAFSKHFRYAYQNEHRFCWFPPHPVERVKHCDISIGSLKDFCELVVL